MTYDQVLSQQLPHTERVALLSALVAWRDARRWSRRPTLYNDTSNIATVVYAVEPGAA